MFRNSVKQIVKEVQDKVKRELAKESKHQSESTVKQIRITPAMRRGRALEDQYFNETSSKAVITADIKLDKKPNQTDEKPKLTEPIKTPAKNVFVKKERAHEEHYFRQLEQKRKK